MNAHRKMTPKGQMSNSGMGPAIANLPPHLKALFEPNPPLDHVPQLTKRKMPGYAGVGDMSNTFEVEQPPPRTISETPKERQERVRVEKMAQNDAKMKENLAKWDPHADKEKKTKDAYKTLFVGRISYETTEKQLQQEFEVYGPIRNVRLVEDEDGKSRGYAFIEYERESDLKAAYKQADGKKIDGRRVVVDVERGRTVHDWKPRKFGGGIGDTRKGGADVNVKYSGREPISNVKIGGGGMRDRDNDRGGRGIDRYGGGGVDRYGAGGGRERSRSRPRANSGGNGYGGGGRDRDHRRDRDRRSHSRSRGRRDRYDSRDRGSSRRDR